MKCARCGCELPKGSGFCFQCGAKQPGYRFPKKLAIGAAAFLLAVGGACVVGTLLMGNHKYVAYLKDGSVNQADLEHPRKKTVKYSGDYGEKDNNPDAYVKVEYSRDGKYIFYPTEVTRESDTVYPEYCLNMQKVGKEDDPIKLDNSVWRYHVLEQNKVLYIKSGNNTLYINDKKGNKEKIASHVEDYP